MNLIMCDLRISFRCVFSTSLKLKSRGCVTFEWRAGGHLVRARGKVWVGSSTSPARVDAESQEFRLQNKTLMNVRQSTASRRSFVGICGGEGVGLVTEE